MIRRSIQVRRLEALRDHCRHRQVGEDRGAEIAVRDLPHPFPEPDQERAVEAEACPDALDVGGRCLIAGDHRGGIARRDVEQAEHEQRHHRHHRDGREEPPEDEVEHGGMIAGLVPVSDASASWLWAAGGSQAR
jgi:hypothetical protein